jgi:hypothetical protein
VVEEGAMSGGFTPTYEPYDNPCESTDTTRKHAGWTYAPPPEHPEIGWRCLAHLIKDVQDAGQDVPAEDQP